MKKYVVNNDLETLGLVGGKAINLIKLSKIEDIIVPQCFYITTDTFKRLFDGDEKYKTLIKKLNQLTVEDSDKLVTINREIRQLITNVNMPKDIIDEISDNIKSFSPTTSFSVRSSATSEDLPNTSFAGQHDTYLNVVGIKSIIKNIIKCWASLFSDRAVIYRIKNGFAHSSVYIAVIIQEMIIPYASGIMFTADPITGNRKKTSIDVSYGIGEALVSGLVSPDTYKVDNSGILEKKISIKEMMIKPLESGGTKEYKIDDDLKERETLTDFQINKLYILGKKIEFYFKKPQDIEWCLYKDKFYFLQSRDITTLYPVPDLEDDKKHIYLSSGHMQMMSDPVKPLGIFFYKTVLGNPPSKVIGGRLYVDITHDLSSAIGRFLTKKLIAMFGDILLTNSVNKIINNKKLLSSIPRGKDKVFKPENSGSVLSIMFNAYKIFKQNDPDIIKGFMDKEDRSIQEMKEQITKLSGEELFNFIDNDHDNRRQKIATPQNAGALTAVTLSQMWFNKKIEKWLGIKGAADTFIMSIPNSLPTETGFALLDVADVIRDFPKIVNYLHSPVGKTFYDDILKFDGGDIVVKSIKTYLLKYGYRCSGDIDITTPRWIEKPTELIPIILNNIKNFDRGESKRKYENGLITSQNRIDEIVNRVKMSPFGKRKAKKVKRVAGLIRNYIGFREYPKFSYMMRYQIYKNALLREAKILVDRGLLKKIEDIYYLYFNEFRDVVVKNKIDYEVIETRKQSYYEFNKLTPPRIMTSDGEIIDSEYNIKEIPKGSLPGVPVSSGIIEGRARIVDSFKDADLENGDILITKFTDPSWTPLFVSIKGLVTEIGGLVTHGAIIAREYGLPAVVSVKNVTKLIKDGQMIRVNGTTGYVEIIKDMK